MICRVLLLSLFIFLLVPRATAAETPAEYRAVLAETLRAAERADRSTPTLASLAASPEVAAALDRLERASTIEISLGRTVATDNSNVIRLLRGRHDEGRRGIAGLRALLAALDAAGEQATPEQEAQARDELDKILARPEFRGADDPIGRWIAELRARIDHWLASLWPGFSIPPVPWPNLGAAPAVAVWVVVIAVALFALAFLALAGLSGRHSLARYAAIRLTGEPEQDGSAAARLAAQQAAQTGDYRSAIHFLYLQAVFHLAARSRLPEDSSLTNHEQLRVLAGGGDAQQLLAAAVQDFDRLWYGHSPCGSAEFRRFRDTVDRLVEETG